MMTLETFHLFLAAMIVIAIFVFCALYFVEAGYGIMVSKKWGPSISNKTAWILMEAPVFFVMLYLWYISESRTELTPLVFFLFFQLHYFQRSFVFPFLISGKGRMPIVVMSLGILFNILNGYMQGIWLFHLAPFGLYTPEWLTSPQFIIGTVLFVSGMAINWNSDYIIRHLRAPGDTKHYLPSKGMYRYITSANYFGEIVEWVGFAILTWSLSGAVFAIWTIANLVPRANSIYKKYQQMFGDEFYERPLKRVFPFLY